VPGNQVHAIVAFSFGLRRRQAEPNPCNVRLARAVERAIELNAAGTLLIAQWEIAKQLIADGVHVDLVVKASSSLDYLDTNEVWRQAQAVLRKHQVQTVIPIAQPFLHMYKVRKLIERSGLTVARWPIGWIGFDSSKDNLQWWTRGPLRLLLYSIKQSLGS